MARLDLTNRADFNMRALSGGMKRRVLVAQALVHKPPVIILDEPTAGVDVELRQGLWQFVRQLNGEGHTIVLTTHYLDEAELLCSRVGMLKQGRLVALDSTHNLLKGLLRHPFAFAIRARGIARQSAWCADGCPGKRGIRAGAEGLRGRGADPGTSAAGWPRNHRTGNRAAGPGRSVCRHHAQGMRQMTGFATLLRKEILRFWKVSFQTVLAPVLTALLYLLIFSHVLDEHVQVYPGVRYTVFLIPGLVMMSLLQNAFANSSSSLIQSKVTGNIIFILLPPLSHLEFFGAYILASAVRGMAVGLGVFAVTSMFVPVHIGNPFWVLAFALIGSGIAGCHGYHRRHLGGKI